MTTQPVASNGSSSKRLWCKILNAPSSQSPEPDEWGHRFWYCLNAEAQAIDRAVASPALTEQQRDEVRLAVRASIEAKMYTLPCDRCQTHFSAYVRDHPIDPSTLLTTSSVQSWLSELDKHIRVERKKDEEAAAAAEAERKRLEAEEKARALAAARSRVPLTQTIPRSSVQQQTRSIAPAPTANRSVPAPIPATVPKTTTTTVNRSSTLPATTAAPVARRGCGCR